ncbi:HAMP domain-containing protein [Leptospira fluminis]|uniref:HAMP domain-containing protein n=1 Tax=Leptospira fluminis TaxID=2484979 RepID=A0A4R9GRT3_9LEPT|nr:HAMP domain-containing protein [Leptospira fluminis]TGK20902.1 HAMP domain-containing protein [Leptospira fluminis]
MTVLTFASVCYLTGFIVSGLCAFFLLAPKDKFESTIHLGWVFLYFALMQAAFLVGTSLFYPISFLHRWISIPCSILACSHLISYFFFLNPQASVKTGRALLAGGFILALASLILHVLRTSALPPSYDFSGSSFDMIRIGDEKFLAWIVCTYLGGALILGAVRAFQAPRADLKLMAISLWVPFLLLFGTTLLFHAGEIALPVDRAMALSFWNPIFLVALFVSWLVHLRASGEAFSIKNPILLGIVLLLLFVFQGSSWLFLQPSLDSLRETVSERQKAEDLPPNSYTFTVNNTEEFSSGVTGSLNSSIFKETKRDLILSFLWENPKTVVSEYPAYSGVAETLKGSPEYAEKMAALSKDLEKFRKKIRALSETGLKEEALKILEAEGKREPLAQYLKILSGSIRNSSEKGEDLRESILDQMRELLPDGEPRFRTIPGTTEKYYYSLIQKSPGKTQSKETGIPYKDYLAFQTKLLAKPLLAFLLCLLLFGIGIYAFLSFLLLRPLERLYSGLELATEGDLERELRAEAWDEIGSLADQFNRMIQSFRSAPGSNLPSAVSFHDGSWQEALQKIKMTDSPKELSGILSELEKFPSGDPNRAKLILKAALKAKDFGKALSAAEEIRRKGHDSEATFLASYCLKKIGKRQDAIRLSEEVRLSNPRHSRNRLHLAELYFLEGRLSEAQDLASEIESDEGPSSTLTKLLNAIEKKGY